jgi:hypothetical protein
MEPHHGLVWRISSSCDFVHLLCIMRMALFDLFRHTWWAVALLKLELGLPFSFDWFKLVN